MRCHRDGQRSYARWLARTATFASATVLASAAHAAQPGQLGATSGSASTAAQPSTDFTPSSSPTGPGVDRSAGAPKVQEAVESSGEILVTARRRSETLVSVPDSVTAFTPAQIAERRLQNIGDFLSITSNVRLVREQDAGNNSIYIRGIGGGNKGQASAVAFVVDGVIMPDPDAYTVDLSDAQSVEVLKGPQGALYGKGAHAGVINITTRTPTDEFHADAKLSYGNADTFNGFLSLQGPLAGDSLLGGITYKRQDTDGLLKNDGSGGDFEFIHSNKVTGRLIAKPAAALTFDLTASYYSGREGNPPYTAVDVLGTGSTRITKAEIDAPIAHDRSDAGKREVFTSALTTTLDLGWAALKSITAYDRVKFRGNQDLDFTDLDVAFVQSRRFTRGFSQELRIVSNSSQRFRYIAGVYYQNTLHTNDQYGYLDFCFLGVASCPTPPLVVSGSQTQLHLSDYATRTRTYAAFAQVNYDLTRQIELTAALRYDRDEPTLTDALTTRVTPTHFSAWEPKVSLAYKPSRFFTVYATAARGYKPGVVNQPTTNPRFQPIARQETADSEEVGVKANILERKATATFAAFHTRYKDAQIFQLDIESGGNQTANIPHVEIKGLEASFDGEVIPGVRANASLGYTKSTIKNFDGTPNYVGQSMPGQPRYNLNLGLSYKHRFDESNSLTPRIDFAQFGKTSFQDFQDPNPAQYLTQGAYHTVDLQVAFSSRSWTITAFGRNVFNERYVNTAITRYISSLLFVPLARDILAPADGASYGIEIRKSF